MSLLILATTIVAAGGTTATPAHAASPTAAMQAECTPGTYGVTPGGGGWMVCDVNGQWVYGGDCPPNTRALMVGGMPYCVPPGFEIPGPA